ncbi:MAG: GNAT family N-acetyltransferase [Alphaproteobacteria bacterium]|nr:GNAT family N-acetyltransferase [Alphaproteobacteria bacterium]
MSQTVSFENETISGGLRASPLPSLRATSVHWEGLQAHREAWLDLARRAADPSIFADPLFLTASLQHESAARRPLFVLTFAAPGGQLTGVFPVHIPRRGLGLTARLWFNPMMADGAPLLDPDHARDALAQLGQWIAAKHPHVKAIAFPALASEGAAARAWKETASAAGLGLRDLGSRTRAVASREGWLKDAPGAKPSRGSLKELRRLQRRLGEGGALAYVSAQNPNDLRPAMERFLALEAAGWKGQRGTAMLCDPSTATFARALIRHLARRGRCRIDALERDGKPVAMGIAFVYGARAFYWKTCFDEAFARYSPGALFTLELTQNLLGETGIEEIDSCAIENHPMIDRLWLERKSFADYFLAVPGATSGAFAMAVRLEETRRNARTMLKNGWLFLTRRKAS